MSQMVDRCPLTKFKGDAQPLRDAGDDAVDWPKNTVTTSFA